MIFNPDAGGRTGGDPGRTAARAAPQVDAENLHLALILNLIRSGEASTRQDIERCSGLGRAIVTDRLAKLTELGLIEDSERGQSTGGRAPRVFRFRKDAGLILLAVIDTTAIGVGCADLSGHLVAEHYEAANADEGPGPILGRLATLFDWLLETHQRGREIWGIGLTVAAPVESVADQPFASPHIHSMPGWQDYPLVETLAARYGAGVWVRSNTQMMTLGEFAAGSSAPDMILVDIGREISAGLISGGRLHVGAQGGAGMLGHFFADETAQTVCRCGKRGCLETVAGAEVIVRAATQGAQDGKSRLLEETLSASDEITAADVGVAAQRGDSFSVDLLARSGRLIGAAIAEMANAFNPSLIVLSGSLIQTSDILLSAIRETVYRRSHPLVARELRIVRSQMGASAALTGAATVVVDNLYATAPLSFWVALGSPLRHPEYARQIEAARLTLAARAPRPQPPTAPANHVPGQKSAKPE
jgi:predicted NBD/HSP70 family sugar kinase